MVILALIIGSVFGVVWQAADSAAELRVLDARDQQVSRFLVLYRKTLESLPLGTSIEITAAEESASGQEEMKIDGATTAYAMGVNADTDGETIIALIPQATKVAGGLEDYVGSLFQVAVSREDFKPLADEGEMAIRMGESDPFFEVDDEGRYWLPLLNDIVSMTWRYWDKEQSEWVETWEAGEMPEMLELSLLDPWRPAPLRVVFEMPSHLVQGGEQTAGSNGAGADSQTSGGATGASSSSRPPADGRPPQNNGKGERGGRDGKSGAGARGEGRAGGGSRNGGGRAPGSGGGGGRPASGGAGGSDGASAGGGAK